MNIGKGGIFIWPILSVVLFLSALPAIAQTHDEKLTVANRVAEEASTILKDGQSEKFESGREKFLTASRLYREIGEKDGEAGSLIGAGMISDKLKEKRTALDYFNQALILFRAMSDKEWEVTALTYIGNIYDSLGEMQNALDHYNQSLSIQRRSGDKNGEASTLMAVGRVYSNLGEKQKALEPYLQALPILRQGGAKSDEAMTLNSIGRINNDIGERQKALEFLNQSLELSRSVGDKNTEAETLNNIGGVYDALGEKQKALDFYNQSLTLFRKLDDRTGEASTLNNIGSVYSDQGDKTKALDFYAQSLELRRQVGDKRGEATELNNIGSVSADRGEKQKALEYLDLSLSANRAVGDKDGEATALVNIGGIYFDLGRKEKALECTNQALSLFRAINNRSGEATALSNVMNIWDSLKNSALAVFYGKQSVNIRQQLRSNIEGMDKKTQQSFLTTVEGTYRKLADILAANGRFFEAQQVLGLLKDAEYSGYVKRDADEIKKLTARADLRTDERAALEKYSGLAGKVTEIGVQFEKLEKEKNFLPANAVFSRQAEYDDLRTKLETANTAFRIFLEKDLVAELGKSVKKEIEIDRALQSKLQQWGNGTVAIYTIAGEDRYRVILTTPKTQIDSKTEIKSADLNKKIFDFRQAVQNPAIDPRPLGKELYDILIKPIENDLKAANAKTLLLSLDGTLRYIPIAALSPDGNHYLAEKYQTVVVTSTTRQSLLSEVDRNWQMLGAGVTKPSKLVEPNGTEQLSFSALPDVESELRGIVRNEGAAPGETGILAGRRLMDEGFTVMTLEEEMSSRVGAKPKYNVVHLATHFRLGSDSTRSFLLLGGNQAVTLEKVSDDALLSFGDVELVTLSACNTGFGTRTESKAVSKEQERNILAKNNGSEVDSLATFIELRGAKAIMATLWSVSDESTSLFMREFYRLKKTSPEMTKADAIQRAQLSLLSGEIKGAAASKDRRSDPIALDDSAGRMPLFVRDPAKPFAHPHYWASFVLIGNWR